MMKSVKICQKLFNFKKILFINYLTNLFFFINYLTNLSLFYQLFILFYQLFKKSFFITNMSYYWDNREKILNKYHNLGRKEKAAEYYQNDKDIFNEKSKNRYRNLSEEKKEIKRQYSRNRYQKLIGKL